MGLILEGKFDQVLRTIYCVSFLGGLLKKSGGLPIRGNDEDLGIDA